MDRDICSVMRVNKHFNKCGKDDNYWRDRSYSQMRKHVIDQKDIHQSWMKWYIDRKSSYRQGRDGMYAAASDGDLDFLRSLPRFISISEFSDENMCSSGNITFSCFKLIQRAATHDLIDVVVYLNRRFPVNLTLIGACSGCIALITRLLTPDEVKLALLKGSRRNKLLDHIYSTGPYHDESVRCLKQIVKTLIDDYDYNWLNSDLCEWFLQHNICALHNDVKIIRRSRGRVRIELLKWCVQHNKLTTSGLSEILSVCNSEIEHRFPVSTDLIELYLQNSIPPSDRLFARIARAPPIIKQLFQKYSKIQ